jgi:hypothetical protein
MVVPQHHRCVACRLYCEADDTEDQTSMANNDVQMRKKILKSWIPKISGLIRRSNQGCVPGGDTMTRDHVSIFGPLLCLGCGGQRHPYPHGGVKDLLAYCEWIR